MTTCNPFSSYSPHQTSWQLFKSRALAGLWLLTLALLPTTAPAGEAIFSFSGALGGYVNGTGAWSFQPQQELSVTALGCFDFLMSANGPTSVGLWAADGSLLASNLVTGASGLLNQTRYAPIIAVTLEPGQTYFVGSYSQEGTTIVYGISGPPDGSLTTAPELQLGTAMVGIGGFVFPGTAAGGPGSAILGPNFQYVVPEPSCAALLGLGALGLALSRRSR